MIVEACELCSVSMQHERWICRRVLLVRERRPVVGDVLVTCLDQVAGLQGTVEEDVEIAVATPSRRWQFEAVGGELQIDARGRHICERREDANCACQ